MKNRPTIINLDTNKPFFLERSDFFWVVAAGDIEIYYVKRDKNGALKSSRNYMYTAKKGEVLFSLKTKKGFDEFSLIAVSPQGRLIEVNKSYIGNLDKNQLSQKIENWVTDTSKYIHQENKPKVYRDLASAGSFELKKDEIAFPAKKLLWMQISAGSVSIFGEDEKIETHESSPYPRLFL